MHVRKDKIVRLGISLLALVVLLGAIISTGAYLTSSHAASSQVPRTSRTVWKVTGSVQREMVNNLASIAARTANDVWAVGASSSSVSTLQYHTLIEHWNGSRWSIVKSPNAGSHNLLKGVVALSATNAWAVGFSGIQPSSPLIEHWNGRQWSIVALPAGDDSELLAVAARSANDVWAVGDVNVGGRGARHALIEHWNGTAWSSFIDPTADISLDAVTVLASNDVWAVGSTVAGASSPVAFHWDGQQWKSVPTQPAFAGGFTALTALSANNIWAVGAQETSGNLVRPLIEHWNGTAWSIVPPPDFSASADFRLFGITALSANNIWAVGNTINGQSNTERNLILHWDGNKWNSASVPVASSACELSSASSASGVAWAAGSCLRTNSTTTFDTLIIKSS